MPSAGLATGGGVDTGAARSTRWSAGTDHQRSSRHDRPSLVRSWYGYGALADEEDGSQRTLLSSGKGKAYFGFLVFFTNSRRQID